MKVLHGENQIASRDQLLRLKSGRRAIEFAGGELSLTELVAATNTTSLFGEEPLIVVEGLFSRRPTSEKKEVVEYLETHQDVNLVIWEAKEVSAQLKQFSPQVVQRFDLPKLIFSFLDNLDLNTYHELLEQMPVEQIFASLVTRTHKVSTGESRSRRCLAIDRLLEVDYRIKTGALPMDLECALEVLLVDRYTQRV